MLTGEFRTAWEIHFHTADEVGANMAEFAIGSLATMASKNPRIPIHGTVPHLGSRLHVYWPYAIALCLSIAGIHLALFLATVITTKGVISKDDSNLSTARLLRPLVESLGTGGTLLSGKKIGEVTQRNGFGGLVYGPRQGDNPSEYVLDIRQGIRPLGDKRHPNGKYL